jgi:phosphohistidine phosphatase
MLILIVRHAQAGEQDPKKYPDDTLRPLTRKGREIHAEVSRVLRKRKLIPGAIYSSPWKRAMQTAQVMARELGGKGLKPKPVPSLADDPDLDAIRQDLSGIEGLEAVAIVGHEPWLSGLASLLLTGEPHRVSIDFPKSGIIGIEADAIEAGSGMLKFFLRPKLL